MRGLRRIAFILLPLTAVITTAQENKGGNPEAAKLQNPVAATPESIAAGEAVYGRRCRVCHGKDATGGARNASNLVDSEWTHGSTDGEIFSAIRNGVGPLFVMEPWAGLLSETDTWNLVNFLRSLAKK